MAMLVTVVLYMISYAIICRFKRPHISNASNEGNEYSMPCLYWQLTSKFLYCCWVTSFTYLFEPKAYYTASSKQYICFESQLKILCSFFCYSKGQGHIFMYYSRAGLPKLCQEKFHFCILCVNICIKISGPNVKNLGIFNLVCFRS